LQIGREQSNWCRWQYVVVGDLPSDCDTLDLLDVTTRFVAQFPLTRLVIVRLEPEFAAWIFAGTEAAAWLQ
jgi:hypothetical protein